MVHAAGFCALSDNDSDDNLPNVWTRHCFAASLPYYYYDYYIDWLYNYYANAMNHSAGFYTMFGSNSVTTCKMFCCMGGCEASWLIILLNEWLWSLLAGHFAAWLAMKCAQFLAKYI